MGNSKDPLLDTKQNKILAIQIKTLHVGIVQGLLLYPKVRVTVA